MDANNCSETYNLILNMHIFRKSNNIISIWTTCDQYFFMKLAPLDSAHIELYINPCQKLNFYKISRVVPFLILITFVNTSNDIVFKCTATPMPVPESNVACTYYTSHKVVRVNITRETTIQDDSEELRHYEVSLNSTSMKTNVSAQSENPNGLFYPVEEDNVPRMAQIVAVDVYGQQSHPTRISCTSGGSPTTTDSSAAICILAITSMLLIKRMLMC